MRRALLIAAMLLAAPAHADAPVSLGKIDFPVTGGTPEARQHFQRGLLALHSFLYDEAKKHMADAVAADPTFTMGWWGVAMSHCMLLWFGDDLAASRAALARITGVDKLTPRERAWIDAARALFGEGNTLARHQAYASALEKMHADFPEDDEITTNYALALISSRPPSDPDELAVRARAAGMAMEVFQRNPRHPGAAHYIIHALDTAELAPLALPAARQYASIAPEAFHARHMPAHIFSRLGMWAEALASCQSAWEASIASAERDKLGTNGRDFHSLNWILEIDFQLGRRKDAEASLATFAEGVRSGMNRRWRRVYADDVAAFMDSTGRWDRADELLAPLSAAVVDPDDAARIEACAHSPSPDLDRAPLDLYEASRVADLKLDVAAKRHQPAQAKQAVAEMQAVQAKLRPYMERQGGKEQLARREKMQALRIEVALAEARGDDKALLAALRQTAEIVDKQPLGEGAIFYGGIHEQIADTLLRLKQPKEALAEYQGVLRRHPRYARGLLGAARAASQSGDAAGARRYYAQAAEVWNSADPDFPGVAEARKARETASATAPPAGTPAASR